MFFKRVVFIFILFLICFAGLKAQILDDTTVQVYGPRTTFYLTEDDYLHNRINLQVIDTTLNDLHNLPVIYGRNQFFQDLGVLGTPLQFFGQFMPDRPGRRYGNEVFSIYGFDPQQIRYYDTRSPFSSVTYFQGNRGQQFAEFDFSRNVNYHWNFGMSYRRFTSRRIIGLQRNVRQSGNHSFSFFTRYFTPNDRYHLLANFVFQDHINHETGGIAPEADDTTEDVYGYLQQPVYLNFAAAMDKRFNFRVYQQLSLSNGEQLQIYNLFNFSRRFNRFRDNTLTIDSIWYNALGLVPTPEVLDWGVNNRTNLDLMENEAGLKGRSGDLFYRAYVRYRNISYLNYYNEERLDENELFIGGKLSYALTDTADLWVQAEVMPGGDNHLKLAYKGQYLMGGAERMVYSPTLYQSQFIGKYFQWNNDFDRIRTNRLFIRADLKGGSYFFAPELSYHTINRHIYYGADALPRQALPEQTLNVFSAKVQAGVTAFNFHLENYLEAYAVSGQNNADTLMNLPPFLNRTRLYFQTAILRGTGMLQIGFDLNYRAGYFGDRFMPLTHQFHLNRDFPLETIWTGDVFLNTKIRQTRVFVKMEHITQNWLYPGYFRTPGYTAMPRTFMFGVIWYFFD